MIRQDNNAKCIRFATPGNAGKKKCHCDRQKGLGACHAIPPLMP